MYCFLDSKSLIKLIKSRIDVIRRKRNATQKFLEKDIAELLLNGLDINAYGRVIYIMFVVLIFLNFFSFKFNGISHAAVEFVVVVIIHN